MSGDFPVQLATGITSEIARVGRKDVGVSGESVSMSVSWNAGLYTPHKFCVLVAPLSTTTRICRVLAAISLVDFLKKTRTGRSSTGECSSQPTNSVELCVDVCSPDSSVMHTDFWREMYNIISRLCYDVSVRLSARRKCIGAL